MRNDRIRFIKEHCFDNFLKGNIQKQYKRNGEGLDPNTLDIYTLIRIDVDNDGYLFASIPYNISEDVSFEINNRGLFIIEEN